MAFVFPPFMLNRSRYLLPVVKAPTPRTTVPLLLLVMPENVTASEPASSTPLFHVTWKLFAGEYAYRPPTLLLKPPLLYLLLPCTFCTTYDGNNLGALLESRSWPEIAFQPSRSNGW